MSATIFIFRVKVISQAGAASTWTTSNKAKCYQPTTSTVDLAAMTPTLSQGCHPRWISSNRVDAWIICLVRIIWANWMLVPILWRWIRRTIWSKESSPQIASKISLRLSIRSNINRSLIIWCKDLRKPIKIPWTRNNNSKLIRIKGRSSQWLNSLQLHKILGWIHRISTMVSSENIYKRRNLLLRSPIKYLHLSKSK